MEMFDHLDTSEHGSDTLASSNGSQNTPITDPQSYFDDTPPFPTTPRIAPLQLESTQTVDPRLIDKRFEPSQQSINSIGEHFDLFPAKEANPPFRLNHLVPKAASEALREIQNDPSVYAHEQPWSPFLQHSRQVADGSTAKGSGGPANWVDQCGTGHAPYSPNVHHLDAPYADKPQLAQFAAITYPGSPATLHKVQIDRVPSSPSRSDSSSTISFACDLCPKTFGRDGVLKRHKDTQHGASEIVYFCEECDFDRLRSDKVREHCRNVHGQHKGQERFGQRTGTPRMVPRQRGPNKSQRKA